jgi:prophage maintenance system killer protein
MTSIELVPYEGPNQKSLNLSLKGETFWLTQKQMSELFDTDVTSIARHIKNIYETRELPKKTTTTKLDLEQEEKGRSVTRNVGVYNLDMVISVGYRVNSKRGTQFRIWATKALREKFEKRSTSALSDGKVAEVVRRIVEIIESRSAQGLTIESDEARSLLQVITDYSTALDILDQYDHGRLSPRVVPSKTVQRITYAEAIAIVHEMKKQYSSSSHFGREKDHSLESSLLNIFQTFDGKELYPSFEEKAANLLYLVTKNHSFTDGNKRIAAAIFLAFLHKNRMLHTASGGKRIDDGTLVALTLMTAESKPSDRVMIVNVIITLLQHTSYET